MFPHKVALVVAALGALLILAHAGLGAAGVMTAAQWESGVVIGAIVFAIGAGRALMTR
jgi:phage-related minor tail protein